MAGMDDVDWNGDVGSVAEAGLALPGTLVAVTGTAALRPTICGTKLPVGMSVLAEVAGPSREKANPDGTTTRVVDVVSMGGPLDEDGGVDSVFSAPCAKVMGMLSLACAEQIREFPVAALQATDVVLSDAEKQLRGANTRTIRAAFLRFQSELPRGREQAQAAAAAQARADALREAALQEVDAEPRRQSMDPPPPRVRPRAGQSEGGEDNVSDSPLPRNPTHSGAGGQSSFETPGGSKRIRTAYEEDLQAQMEEAAQNGAVLSHVQLATTLGRGGPVPAGTHLRMCSLNTRYPSYERNIRNPISTRSESTQTCQLLLERQEGR